MGEEFGHGSAVQLFCSKWPSLRLLGGIQLADGLQGFKTASLMSLAPQWGCLDPAGPVNWGTNTRFPQQAVSGNAETKLTRQASHSLHCEIKKHHFAILVPELDHRPARFKRSGNSSRLSVGGRPKDFWLSLMHCMI